ncbi:PilZ domain-containing protein [Novosphingobium huizhouense]|uniref:PilZ domain-containing protein n=1 Tax=Novosphingobium huizhouense TaxID=2866625 RepID=UPI001CD8D749|nr:PilZ domain-containing protein [Novosphingobium huizhouense]
MDEIDHRQLGRDSMFLMADLRLVGTDGEHKVRVRNLSAGGMMAEGSVKVGHADMVDVSLRNIGWVRGAIAWIQDNRFGIAFAEPIDPLLARELTPAPGQGEGTPRFVRPPLATVDLQRLRKI